MLIQIKRLSLFIKNQQDPQPPMWFANKEQPDEIFCKSIVEIDE